MTFVLSRRVRELPRRALVGMVRAYRLFLSPALGASCRFEPSCSVYALGALEAHGASAGTYLTVHRILRCGPWCDGGHDPVPHCFLAPWRSPSRDDDAVRPAPSSSSPTPTAPTRP